MENTEPVIQARGVDFVCIPTTDHDRSVEFYRDVLGLDYRTRWGDRPASELQAGNLVAVFDPRGFGLPEPSPNSAPIAFHVDDVEEAYERLRAHGVEFTTEVFDSGVCLQAVFRDPDGNPLILHNRYAPPAV